MFKTEESKIGLLVLLTGFVTVVTSLMEAAKEEPYITLVIFGGMAVILGAIIVYGLYRSRVKKRTVEVQDERSAQCSLKSTRNGFIVAMISLAAYMIIGQIGAPLSQIAALQTTWMLSFAAYALSYLYYKKVK